MKSRKSLKKKMDTLFSQYIRQKYANHEGYCICVTCGRPVNWKYECDAGHYRPRQHNKTRFDERNVHPQCKSCNGAEGGEQHRHGVYIDKTYGEGTSEELYRLSKESCPYSISDYEEMIADLKERLKEI